MGIRENIDVRDDLYNLEIHLNAARFLLRRLSVSTFRRLPQRQIGKVQGLARAAEVAAIEVQDVVRKIARKLWR